MLNVKDCKKHECMVSLLRKTRGYSDLNYQPSTSASLTEERRVQKIDGEENSRIEAVHAGTGEEGYTFTRDGVDRWE